MAETKKNIMTFAGLRALEDELFDLKDEEVEYTIVGSTEADALNGKISNESPVGAALIGSKVGETIVVETISGDLEFKILEIARA